jgi:hypothetical protein
MNIEMNVFTLANTKKDSQKLNNFVSIGMHIQLPAKISKDTPSRNYLRP